MIDSVLCLVPARSGSKGVPHKNIRPLLGQPLMSHTIRVAKLAMESFAPGVNFQIVVSSDSEDYLRIARHHGVVAISRPAEISKDSTPMVEVVSHALDLFNSTLGFRFQTILLLQPTCPARQPWHIKEALMLYSQHSANSLVSVVRVEDSHPARMYTKDCEGFGHSLEAENALRNRQDLLPVYHRNGSIYIFDSTLVDQNRVLSESPLLYEMDKRYSVNIDDEVDWIFAEALCASLLKS